jgi:NADPH:quinone reductase-like Zn-dependent oxidoreductase
MRAAALVRYGKASTAFKIIETPAPHIHESEVLIEVEGFGLNFADVMARMGQYREAPALPAILGYEVVGRVSELGSKVTLFKKGDRVVAFTRFGGYAEFTSASELTCAKIADDVPLVQATALATQFCTAYFIIEHKMRIKKDDRILIHAAAGGVGTALVQLAKLRGAYVVATIGNPSKRELVQSFGADLIISTYEDDFAEIIRKKFGQHSLDWVCDSVGGATFKKGFKLLRATGTIVGFGAAQSAKKEPALWAGIKLLAGFGVFSPAFLLMESRAIIGVNMLRIADLRPDLIQECMASVIALYEGGQIKPVSGGEYALEQLAQAHEQLEQRKTVGKLAIRIK